LNADDALVASLASNRGAKRAREARAALGIDPVEPLPCLLTTVEEQVGLPVVVARLPEGLAGACYRDGSGTVLWVNGRHATVRQRFTLAHELAHACCKHDGALELDSVQTLSGKTTNPLEIQANAFAAEFLLPKAAVPNLFDREPGLEQVVALAASYGVSASAALIRLSTAGVVGETRNARLKQEIADGDHLAVYDHLNLAPLGDRLGAIADLPYLSPALEGSVLAAALNGAAPVAQAADAAGVDTAKLGPALEAISAP